jgi:hypothetical protein
VKKRSPAAQLPAVKPQRIYTLKHLDKRQIAGWIAVSFSTLITSIWAFWGIVENFHEGWYYESWLSNVGLMFAQYLSPMLIFMGVTLISIFWPRFGGGLHMLFALLAAWFFQAFTNTVMLLLIAPLIGIGILYWFGRPQPRKIAVSLAVGLPILTLFISGIGPIIRVSQRIDDGNLQARLVQGNGVNLIWAPDGPGWPRTGTNWHDAKRMCQYLSEDGLTLSPNTFGDCRRWMKPCVLWPATVRIAVGNGTQKLTRLSTKPHLIKSLRCGISIPR